jgi:hypothetical protein
VAIEELERAMRGDARKKLAAGIEPRDPVDRGRRFEKRRAVPIILIAIAVLGALTIVGFVVSYLITVPLAHIFIVLLAIGTLWLFAKGKKRS